MFLLEKYADYIDTKTIISGGQYYYNHQMEDINWIEKNKLTAKAHGTETYDVSLTIENDHLIDHQCTCPIEQKTICKHKTALIIHLQEERFQDILAKGTTP